MSCKKGSPITTLLKLSWQWLHNTQRLGLLLVLFFFLGISVTLLRNCFDFCGIFLSFITSPLPHWLLLCLTLNVMFLGSPLWSPFLLLYSCSPVAISSHMEISLSDLYFQARSPSWIPNQLATWQSHWYFKHSVSKDRLPHALLLFLIWMKGNNAYPAYQLTFAVYQTTQNPVASNNNHF